MTQTGVTVAIIESDRILLTLREDFEVWCMPGGEVEDGEALADAARREAREETGLEVELTRLVGAYSRIGWRSHHNMLFAARVAGGVIAPDPREVIEARFFPFDALPEHLLIGQRYKIEDAITGVTGTARTEYVATPESSNLSRAELYALRDQSGLSRREFYLRSVPPLTPDAIIVEVSGVEGKPR